MIWRSHADRPSTCSRRLRRGSLPPAGIAGRLRCGDAKTAGKALTINFEVEGTGERYALVLKNRVLNHSAKPTVSPDLTVKGTREAIVLALMNGKPNEAIAQGTIQVEGRAAALSELFELTTRPKFWFPIVTRPKWER